MQFNSTVRSLVRSAWGAALAGLLSVLWCWYFRDTWLFWFGNLGVGASLLRLGICLRKERAPAVRHHDHHQEAIAAAPVEAANEIGSLVDQMLSDGRYALLLRPQIAGDLTDELYQSALQMLEDEMAIVPTGEVGVAVNDWDDPDSMHSRSEPEASEVVIRVDSLYIDRYPVTNEQFQSFVDAGGYEQSSIWHPDILPAVLDFVDRTGLPGPRFWQNGRYPPGMARHPVVGISWYEALAYARWVGKRLPTDAEWVKAGSWPVSLGNSGRRQRRYPWGQTMDRERANLWASGIGSTVSIDEFAAGVSVGGVYQLIGNVWEWTTGDYQTGAANAADQDAEPLKNIRGGAFDTYFENQANCEFSSGEHPLGRKHNIGFRCALGLCDLALQRQPDVGSAVDSQSVELSSESEVSEIEEVVA
ncbi:MAG: SUMF1/EgtB/PvdO family nonheme iron enzyme [Planctomycetota bacterium]|nr:SUMF1/EgtB/PvdO family nonheme iron enzyme [Planctomycetota bacterium]